MSVDLSRQWPIRLNLGLHEFLTYGIRGMRIWWIKIPRVASLLINFASPLYWFLISDTTYWLSLNLNVCSSVVGYIIFRGSNSQKDKFRKDPNDPVFAGQCSSSSQILSVTSLISPRNDLVIFLPSDSSGNNSLSLWQEAPGQWLVGAGEAPQLPGWPHHGPGLVPTLRSVSCCSCFTLRYGPNGSDYSWVLLFFPGFSSVLPYFYPVYFFVLLAHRTSRDNAACRLKHKAAWERYCQRVPHRIIPGVFWTSFFPQVPKSGSWAAVVFLPSFWYQSHTITSFAWSMHFYYGQQFVKLLLLDTIGCLWIRLDSQAEHIITTIFIVL